MSDINSVALSGRMASDPTVYPGEGDRKTKVIFRLMNNDSFDSERKGNAINITVWGKQADALAKHGHKGKELLIEGSIHTYFDAEKEKNYWEVTASKVVYRGNGKSQRADSPPPASTSEMGAAQKQLAEVVALMNSPAGKKLLAKLQEDQEEAAAPDAGQPF